MIMKSETWATVVALCVSQGGIPKLPVEEIAVTFSGLSGDGHNHAKHRTPVQAVCLQDAELLEEVTREGIPLECGTIGENLTVKGLNVQSLPIGTVIEFEGGVVIEITKVRKPCYVLDAVDTRLQMWMKDRCGMYARVVREGVIKKNAAVSKIFKPSGCF